MNKHANCLFSYLSGKQTLSSALMGFFFVYLILNSSECWSEKKTFCLYCTFCFSYLSKIQFKQTIIKSSGNVITTEQVCIGHSGNTWVISQVSVNITLKNNYRVMIHVLLLIRTPINLINGGIIAMATSAETIRIWLTAKVVNTLI